MEIIIITVLSTLGVVALVTAIVVAFVKLKNKVDINKVNKLNDDVYATMGRQDEMFQRKIDETYNETRSHFDDVYKTIDEVSRQLDSRADKLHDLIKLTEKELVNHFDSRVSELEDANSKLAFNNKKLLKG